MSNGIYIASRTRHADKWREARETGVPIISTWIDEAGPGETSDYPDLWTRCTNEAKTAKAVVVFCEGGETLKGALIEAGAALGQGVPIFTVGLDAKEHSWVTHPLVTQCRSLTEAIIRAVDMAEGVQR
jgi:hypothetical protein